MSNSKILCEITEDKKTFCAKTANLQSGTFRILIQQSLELLVSYEYFWSMTGEVTAKDLRHVLFNPQGT